MQVKLTSLTGLKVSFQADSLANRCEVGARNGAPAFTMISLPGGSVIEVKETLKEINEMLRESR